jgi:hypothetical protein
MKARRGHYLGTEVDGVWHRRYRENGWLARGLGVYWIEGELFRFRRYLTRAPLSIPLRRVQAVELAAWHAGRWVAGKRAIKLVWDRDGTILSSGFVFTRTAAQAAEQALELQGLVSSLRGQKPDTSSPTLPQV